QVQNILFTMVLCGIWHGARWTFLAFFLLQGSCIAATHLMNHTSLWPRVVSHVPPWMRRLVTFHIVAFGLILFRADSLQTAFRVIAGVFHVSWGGLEDLAFPFLLVGVALAMHPVDDPTVIRRLAGNAWPAVAWPILAALWILCMALSAGHSAEFIYFDF